MAQYLEALFPGLHHSEWRITSQATNEYNCIAWAANDSETWWDPDPQYLYYWPHGVPRNRLLSSFVQAFQKLGFEPCDSGDLEPGFEKVAIFMNEDQLCTHMARQLTNGRWTSKLGELEDIEHQLDGIAGTQDYGSVAKFLRRAEK